MENVLTKKYQVRFHETDFLGAVRPVTLLNYLQDAAAAHSASFGYPLSYLRERNMTWVLSRYHVRVARYPAIGESIRVHTWRPALDGMFALRDFEVIDSGNNDLAVATSSWVILNLETKRPMKLETVITDFPTNNRRALQDDFPSLAKLEKADMEEAFKVRMADLDMNRHVNHTVYVEWALETVPREILRGFRPVEIEVGYRAEAFYGDTVLVRTEIVGSENSACFLHQLINERDGKELTRLKTIWGQF
jgi:medium-chain acyl-[acyl-carrier-protein] hydrolase